MNSHELLEAPPLAIPLARRFEPDRDPQIECVRVPLPESSLQAAADPVNFLLASWAVLLWRFSDQTEFAIGLDEGGRLLPLKLKLSEDFSFAAVMQQVEHAMQAAAGRLGAIPAAFSVEEACAAPEPPAGRFQLMMRAEIREGPWRADLLYDATSLSRDTAERMARSLAVLLAGAAADLNASAYSLPILSEEDRDQVVARFNQTAAPFLETCTHWLVEDQAERWPDRIAVRDRNQALTYGDLNRRANRLAHFLLREGAGPNVCIGLYLDRSAEMIVALLAVLKSGACYVPLIPTDPPARVARQLGEVGPPLVLTTKALAHALPEYGGQIVRVDEPYEGEIASNPARNVTPDDLVYVLFTSGSTGNPKGVAVRHRNLANYTQFIWRQLQLEDYPQGWRFATVSTLAADLGNTSVFGALVSGGCLHVIDYETAMSPPAFAAYMAEHPVEVLKIAPSHLAALLRGSTGGAVLPQRFVIVGGEKLAWDLLEEIRSRSSCAVMNHYGPTETTVGCCTLMVDEAAFTAWKPATVPLGRPIANDEVYILDRRLQPVPVGVPGELHMSGAGLSAGYFHQPEQTADRFIKNPFSSDPSARLYRTGDLGRFLPDGAIEFLGRTDYQVKIRGFRVEPAEVESALKRHPEVRQAVVLPEHQASGERTLTAYVGGSQTLAEDDLRRWVSQQLPDYMLPQRLVIVDELPLNANGKVDFQALPELAGRYVAVAKAFATPRGPVEEKLAAIWASVLRLDRVGVDENLFALGGHSLLAIQIVAQIREAFRIDFRLPALLANPTIEKIAARLGEFPRLADDEGDLARMLREIEGLSEDEAERLLGEAG
jgi:amino acid adenylation domain-containing protein